MSSNRSKDKDGDGLVTYELKCKAGQRDELVEQLKAEGYEFVEPIDSLTVNVRVASGYDEEELTDFCEDEGVEARLL